MANNKPIKKKSALGRGLGALLEDSPKKNRQQAEEVDTLPSNPTASINEVLLEEIQVNPFQPRTHFDKVALEELAESIRVQGIIQPITVRRLSENEYQLISGERRFQASKLAGLDKVRRGGARGKSDVAQLPYPSLRRRPAYRGPFRGHA
jgi:ParB family transcriptional regulator, chromosome partitioning protein